MGQTIGTIAINIVGQLRDVALLLIIIAYVSGVCFSLAGVIQFKVHKDNPQQTPLTKPIVYLIVGACLLYLPSLIGASGATIFGDNTQSAGNTAGIIE